MNERPTTRYSSLLIAVLALMTLFVLGAAGTALAQAPTITTPVTITNPMQPGDTVVTVNYGWDAPINRSDPAWYTDITVVLRDYLTNAELGQTTGHSGYDQIYDVPVSAECYERWMTATVTITNPDGSDEATGTNTPAGPPTISNIDGRYVSAAGYVGQKMYLEGSNLGWFHNASDIVFEPGGVKAEITDWGLLDVWFTVPKGAETGTVHVTTIKGDSLDFPFTVLDNVTGYVFDGHGDYAHEHPLGDIKVELMDKATKEVLDSDYTDKWGEYKLSYQLEDGKDYRLMATLETEDGKLKMKDGPDTIWFAKDFTTKTPELGSLFGIPIDLSKVAEIADSNLVIKPNYDDCGAVWYYLQRNRQVAKEAGYDPAAAITVSAFDTDAAGTRYGLSEHTIYMEPGDMNEAPDVFHKNRESHEYGHAVMHSILADGWVAGADVGNHAGYLNDNTGDSLAEGFAEYWAMHVDEMKGISGDPDVYDQWGHFGGVDSRMAWSPVDITAPNAAPAKLPEEEFAVAGLLWQLEYALGGGDAGFQKIAAALPLNGTVTHLRNNLIGGGASAAVIDPIFFAHGFFADLDGDWVHDPAEPIGAGNGASCTLWNQTTKTADLVAARTNRQKRPYEPNAFVGVNLTGVPGAAAVSYVTIAVTYPGSPEKDYSSRDVVVGSSGLSYVYLEPGAVATLTVTGPDGGLSPDSMSFTDDEWSAARGLVMTGAALTKTFRVDRVTVGDPVAPKTMSPSKSYSVTGTLKPHHAAGAYPLRIYKYHYVSGKWKDCGYVKARASDFADYSKCSCKVKLALKGKWRLRAQAPADGFHARTWSRGYAYVTVK